MNKTIEAERKELEDAIAEMQALDRETYFNQDIVTRIDQARMVMELEEIDPLIWRDTGIGITLSDILCDARFEIKKLTPAVDIAADISEQAHWIAAPISSKLKPEDTEKERLEGFHLVVERAEKVITLLHARERTARCNLEIATDTIKVLEKQLKNVIK